MGRTGVDSSQGSGVTLESKAGDLHLTPKKTTPNLCWHRVLKSYMRVIPSLPTFLTKVAMESRTKKK